MQAEEIVCQPLTRRCDMCGHAMILVDNEKFPPWEISVTHEGKNGASVSFAVNLCDDCYQSIADEYKRLKNLTV